MRTRHSVLLVLFPLLAWLGFWLWLNLGHARFAAQLQPADGLQMGAWTLRVHAPLATHGGLYRLQLENAQGESQWVGSFPQCGPGSALRCFVHAMQMDQDPALEAVAWSESGMGFYLDANASGTKNAGVVAQYELSRNAQPPALRNWRWYNVIGPHYLTLGAYLLPAWYGALGLAAVLRRRRRAS